MTLAFLLALKLQTQQSYCQKAQGRRLRDRIGRGFVDIEIIHAKAVDDVLHVKRERLDVIEMRVQINLGCREPPSFGRQQHRVTDGDSIRRGIDVGLFVARSRSTIRTASLGVGRQHEIIQVKRSVVEFGDDDFSDIAISPRVPVSMDYIVTCGVVVPDMGCENTSATRLDKV